nr:helitron helicase-like domain-containing protein [Tanacetum cinerariifolium]
MLVYEDLISSDELLSDSFSNNEILDGILLDVNGKRGFNPFGCCGSPKRFELSRFRRSDCERVLDGLGPNPVSQLGPLVCGMYKTNNAYSRGEKQDSIDCMTEPCVTACDNVNAHGSSSSKRQHASVDDIASSSTSRKRSRSVMSRTTITDVGGTFASRRRRRVSSGRHDLNTSSSTHDPVCPIGSPKVRTHGSAVHHSRTCPPLEYTHIGNCEHSCEHCGSRFRYKERIKNALRRARLVYHQCCKAGHVVLRTYQIYPEYIQLLSDCHFMENIRAYNQMFIMTSLGARIDDSINIGRGPYVFKISGQLYHCLGSLCLAEGDVPRFLQLYVYDTEYKVDNRMSHFGGDNIDLRRDIVEGLIELLDNHNALVVSVVSAREYEMPIGDMLGAIVYEAGPDTDIEFDIIIEQRIVQPQRVDKLHPSYMALQFLLLFVLGEDGYSIVTQDAVRFDTGSRNGNAVRYEVVSMAACTGCEAGSFPFSYLGLSIGSNMSRIANWQILIDRFKARLSGWKTNLLSIGGRLTLIKSVLGSLGIYYFFIFKAPEMVIKSLESLRANFFWGSHESSKKLSWVKWSNTLASFDTGGLDVGSLNAFNKALLLKWRWRLFNFLNSL